MMGESSIDKEEAFRWFVEGFMKSCEGYNAEYPFGDYGDKPEDDEGFCDSFERAWQGQEAGDDAASE